MNLIECVTLIVCLSCLIILVIGGILHMSYRDKDEDLVGKIRKNWGQ